MDYRGTLCHREVSLFRLEVHKRNAIYGFEFFFSKLLEETHLTAGHLYCKHGKRPIIRPPPPPLIYRPIYPKKEMH